MLVSIESTYPLVLHNLQIDVIQLQLLQAGLDSSSNVVDVVIVHLGSNVQLLTRDTTFFDGCAEFSLGLVDFLASVKPSDLRMAL